jgi:hypothetical protein
MSSYALATSDYVTECCADLTPRFAGCDAAIFRRES